MLSRRIFRAGNANANANTKCIVAYPHSDGPSCLRVWKKNGIHGTFYLNYGARCNSSSNRWKNRQGKDVFAREARIQGLKSRAAFKLLEVGGRKHAWSL